MKRIITLIAVASASLVLAAYAQAQPGIIAGLTSSKSDMSSAVDDVKSIALYHAGLTYKIDLGAGFAIQPSLIYQVKGTKVGNLDTSKDEDWKLKSGYAEIPVGIQWGPDLVAFRPYAFAEPFIGYQVSSSDKVDTFSDWTKQAKNKFEYGFGVGGGLEIASHIQVSVQWFKNLGKMFDENASGSATWEEAKNFNNFQGIKFSLAILF
jgi:hypothetical protein